MTDNDTPRCPETTREKLSGRFEEWTSPPGEYGMILAGETCLIHLIEDDAIPQPGLSEYKGQASGAFYLRRSKAEELISKLRKVKAGE